MKNKHLVIGMIMLSIASIITSITLIKMHKASKRYVEATTRNYINL